MILNLIRDRWIPVLRKTGPDVIRPAQISEADIIGPNWPRADFDLATYELLIGLVYLACPPADRREWREGFDQAPDLEAAFAHLEPAFELMGEGPRFLQELDPTLGLPTVEMREPSYLIIDGAAENAIKANKDVLAHRDRYAKGLDWPTAAIALWTLQSQAPVGGRGHRASLRGGGPLITIVDPGEGSLWSTIWANVPEGVSITDLTELPWMRPTVTSFEGEEVLPSRDPSAPPAPEALFGMPRRIRLHGEDQLEGIQTTHHGTNYNGWRHPLTPYYATADGLLPLHPKSLGFGYRNWRGVVLENNGGARAATVDRYISERRRAEFRLRIGGWITDNTSPVAFLYETQPVFPMDETGEDVARRLIDASRAIGYSLASCLRAALEDEVWTGEASAADGREAGAGSNAFTMLHELTQADFESCLSKLALEQSTASDVLARWGQVLSSAARRLFDAELSPRLSQFSISRRRAAIQARGRLHANLSGYGKGGVQFYEALGLTPPKSSKKEGPADAAA